MNFSVVDYMSLSRDQCGYCKSSEMTSVTNGMWAHLMTADDYQQLVDRGWRRCGMYCYKPVMNETCCPAYTIRCDSLNLTLTKSQKKVLRKFTAFLREAESDGKSVGLKVEEGNSSDCGESRVNDLQVSRVVPQPLSNDESEAASSYSRSSIRNDQATSESPNPPGLKSQPQSSESPSPKPGVGADGSKPPRKKSKLLRLERKMEKMRNAGIAFAPSKNVVTPEKTLEDFVRESDAQCTKKRFQLELVPSCSNDEILRECYHLYKKYQMSVHKDEESELTFASFSNFLVGSPLQPYKDGETPDCGYGSFHQLYRLDGKLIAVGVIDILPKCVSSVYFFYDPDYSHLSLGTYGSLRELHLTRSLAQQSSQLNQYYLGFYIHTCPKMRYKGRLQPSYLLCPEAYSWHPIGTCLSKLDAAKYCRLDDDGNAKSADDDVDLDEILILDKSIMPFSLVKTQRGVSPAKSETLREYAHLVGRTCASRMLLRCW